MLTRRETFRDAGNPFFFLFFYVMVTRVNPYLKAQTSYSLFKYYIMIQQKSNFPRRNNHILDQELENFVSRNQKAKIFGFVGHKISVTDPYLCHSAKAAIDECVMIKFYGYQHLNFK